MRQTPQTRLAAALATAFLALTPVTPAFAQGSGDEQYSDPFDDAPAQTTTSPGSSRGESAPAPAPSAAPTTPAPQAAPGAASGIRELPRTGADLRPSVAAGLLLIGLGLLLLRRSSAARR